MRVSSFSPTKKRSGTCAQERAGQPKSPRALMAWRAKAGDNFGEIFGYFSSTGKVMKKNITPLKGSHPAPLQSNGNRMAVLDDFLNTAQHQGMSPIKGQYG